MQNIRLQNIEFLRFLFAIIIVLYHGGFATTDAYLAVEMFLVLAGYFLALSMERNPEVKSIVFIKNKWFRLWPLFAFAVILGGGNLYDLFFKLFFLHATGITLKYKTFIWFVGPFFWGMLFYLWVIKYFNLKKRIFVIAIITYMAYVYLINYDNGNLNIRNTVNLGFSLAMLRSLAGIGLGILLYHIFQVLTISNTQNKIRFVIISLVEIGIMFFFVDYMVFEHLKYDNKFIFVMFFAIELFLFINCQGILSKVLNNKYCGALGKYAYAIYIMQALGFKLAEKINFGSVLVNQLLIIISLGVIGYHFIENPIYKKWRIKE